jgi:CheY-like chemotaxis protein
MALTKRVLLVVPQRKERDELAKHLDRAGYLLIQVEDGALAINKAIVDPPDMVITQAVMPMVDGFKLCQLLRTNPATRHIPFIFITDKETNPKKLGQFIRPDDDFILKPFKVEELLGRVHNLFYRMDKVQEVSQEADRSVAGTLTEIALVDLLQIFKMNRKNGVLTLRADGVTGQIMIRDGVIINARLGKVLGEKAIYRLISWSHGTFEFKPALTDSEVRVHQPAENLIMEGLRQLDELNRIQSKLIPRKASLRLRKTFTGSEEKLKPVTREVVNLLQYFNRVEDILDNSSFPDLDIYVTLQALIDHEVVIVTSEADTAAAQPQNPLLTLEEALKIGYFLGVGRGGESSKKWVGKILVFTRTVELLEQFLAKADVLPEFDLDTAGASLEQPGIGGTGVVASLSVMDNITLLFLHLPSQEGCLPLWNTFHHRAIGALLLTDSADDELLNGVGLFLGSVRVPVAMVVMGPGALPAPAGAAENGAGNRMVVPSSDPDFARKVFRGLFEAILAR